MKETNNFYNSSTNNNILYNRDENIMNIHNFNNSFNGTRRHISKKRNYFDFIKQYQQINNKYTSQNESSNKIFYNNFKKYMDSKLSNTNNDSLIKSSQYIIKNKTSSILSASQINEHKKYFIDEDIEINDNNNSFKKYKKNQKQNLSSSYFLDDDPGFFSDLEDTKESSFSSLNFSFDYPEISIDSIKGKFITNAIELEKTFYRFFNVKIMPNK